MHLFPADRREPFQELVYRRTLVEVLEQSGNPQSRTTEAPRPAKLAGVRSTALQRLQSPHFPN